MYTLDAGIPFGLTPHARFHHCSSRIVASIGRPNYCFSYSFRCVPFIGFRHNPSFEQTSLFTNSKLVSLLQLVLVSIGYW